MSFEEYKKRQTAWRFKQASAYWRSTRKAIDYDFFFVGYKDQTLCRPVRVKRSVRKWLCHKWLKQVIRCRNMSVATAVVLLNIYYGSNIPGKVKRWVESRFGGVSCWCLSYLPWYLE